MVSSVAGGVVLGSVTGGSVTFPSVAGGSVAEGSVTGGSVTVGTVVGGSVVPVVGVLAGLLLPVALRWGLPLSPVGTLFSFSPQAVNAKSIDKARSNARIFFIFFPPELKSAWPEPRTEKCTAPIAATQLPYPHRHAKRACIFTK